MRKLLSGPPAELTATVLHAGGYSPWNSSLYSTHGTLPIPDHAATESEYQGLHFVAQMLQLPFVNSWRVVWEINVTRPLAALGKIDRFESLHLFDLVQQAALLI